MSRAWQRKYSLNILSAIFLLGLASLSFSKTEVRDNSYWWPNKLNLSPLRHNEASANPLGMQFNYAKEFKTLDLNVVVKDIEKVLTDSKDWWPADFGHYGPLFIRMAWHSAGTYRVYDGRGGAGTGQQRFAPLNSWPDNANLDKARRLLWPIKKKYGSKLSWADLMILAGDVSLQSMGFEILGFAGGRADVWEPEVVNWGHEDKWLGSQRHHGDRMLDKPLAATHMGLIYVNPEGPNGVPDPIAAAKDIRETFARMAMNDEETVALIAGGHSFGKMHGAAPASHVGPEPEAAPIEQQGFGWKSNYKSGKGVDTITSGLEGAWTVTPAKWSHNYFQNLFHFDWVKTKSPAGAHQWVPKESVAGRLVPDAHDASKRHAPIMLTTDLSLKMDPAYRKISERFMKNPKAFERAFAKAWFKLTHRDMGPRSRYLGSMVPKEIMIWQDPVPEAQGMAINADDIEKLKKQVLDSGLSGRELVKTAWAAAVTFRKTDMRGGANGARLRLAPQVNWEVNDPAELKKVLDKLGTIQQSFNAHNARKVSLADLIVLAGGAAIEKAADAAGYPVKVGFKPGRTDASAEQTDVASFEFLRPKADAFRNYFGSDSSMSPARMMVDKASMLNLTVPEMTVLIGGLRVLDANTAHSKQGVFTHRPGVLSNDFFVNLLDMSTQWQKSQSVEGTYDGVNRKTGQKMWQASAVDLLFGSNSELRAIAEVYASDDAQAKFVQDFAVAWSKVMQLDRFDLHYQ